jgi:hypothetical protein
VRRSGAEEIPMRKFLVFLMIATLAAGLLAACGGDDDDSTAASNGNDKSSTTKAGADNGDTTDSTTGNAEYDALLKKARTATYRVTYQNENGDQQFTISQDPPKSAFITDDGSRFVRDGDTSVSCDGSGSDAQCFKLPGGAGIDQMVTGFFGAYAALLATSDDSHGLGLDISRTSDEEIAGRSAKCAQIEPGKLAGAAGADGRVKYCVDAETGVLLLAETEGNGETSKIEATEFGEPEAGDFEIPDNVTDLGASIPSIPGN